jgi:Response regulator containing a CheY-like receiver domain and an HTH DNA-binding domain
LLIDGYTQSEAARKLRKPITEVGAIMKNIREKIGRESSTEERISLVSKEYGLTKRETQVLSSIYQSRTSREIAEELFISEETVRFHTKNLMKKLPVMGRYDLITWLDMYEEDSQVS